MKKGKTLWAACLLVVVALTTIGGTIASAPVAMADGPSYTGFAAAGHHVCEDWVIFDDFRVRQYCENEPEISWQAEQGHWAYRMQGSVISGTGGNISEAYQMELIVHRGSGTHIDNHIYLDGKCQADFADIRFTNTNDQTLDYWIERIDDSVAEEEVATIWIKFDSISKDGTPFYIYYGNNDSNLASASDGYNTFIVFHDGTVPPGCEEPFEDWLEHPSGVASYEWTIEDGAIRCTSDECSGCGGWSNLYYKDTTGTNSYIAEARIRAEVGTQSGNYQQGIGYWTCYPMARWLEVYNKWGLRDLHGESKSDDPPDTGFNTAYWHDYKFVKDGNAWKLYVDEDENPNPKVTRNAENVPQYIGMYAFFYGDNHWAEFDDFRVHNYCYPEPVFNGFGDEESAWGYEQQGTIDSSEDLTDYQVSFKLYPAEGTTSDNNIYLNNHAQPDFGDVRFTTDTSGDGMIPETYLDYWIEKIDENGVATVWVEFDQVQTTGTEFYIYYGNPSASSESNGYNTFIIFNDGSSIEGWTEHPSGETKWDWSSVELLDGNKVIKCDTAHADAGMQRWGNLYCNIPIAVGSYTVEAKIKAGTDNIPGDIRQGIGYGSNELVATWCGHSNPLKGRCFNISHPNGVCSNPASGYDALSWHDYRLIKNDQNVELAVDDVSRISCTITGQVPSYIGMWAMLYGQPHSGRYHDVEEWFDTLGYTTEAWDSPHLNTLRSHIQSTETAVFYTIGHGGGTYQTMSCDGDYRSAKIKAWIEDYPKIPFTFIEGCSAGDQTSEDSIGYALRKGESVGAVTIHTDGDPGSAIDDWKDEFFGALQQEMTVSEAFNHAQQEAYVPQMRLTGDGSLKLVENGQPALTRMPVPSPSPTLEPGWNYRQKGTITGRCEVERLTNYQVELIVSNGSGSNTNNRIYLNGNCEADFADIRFTNAEGRLLDYWIQEIDNSDPGNEEAVVWVEFDEILDSGTDFYVYYSNPSATSSSNGGATWRYFDDFEQDMDGWKAKIWSTNCTRWDGQAHSGTYSVLNDAMAQVTQYDFSLLQNPSRVLVFCYDNASDKAGRFYTSIYDARLHWEVLALNDSSYYQDYFYRLADGYHNSGMQRTTGWHRFEWVQDSGGVEGYIDKALLWANESAFDWTTIHFGNNWGNGVITNASMDDVCVGEYCSPQPVIDDWGGEEQLD